MRTRTIIIAVVVLLLACAAILDAVRYLKQSSENKIVVYPANPSALDNPQKITFVYNAYGGIYPGIADIIHKEFFPKSYPCNLCYQAFGTFGKKEGWKSFLNTIPLQKAEFHIDDFMRKFKYKGDLPLILISNSETTQILLSAEEINTATSLKELINLTKRMLEKV